MVLCLHVRGACVRCGNDDPTEAVERGGRMKRKRQLAKAATQTATIPVAMPVGVTSLSAIVPQRAATVRTEDVSAFSEIGVTGLRQFAGYLKEEFITDMADRTGRARFNEMVSNHPMIRAGMNTIGQHMLQIPIRVEAGGDSNEDRRAADLVETSLRDMSFSWSDTLLNIQTRLVYGWQLSEITYKRRLGDDPPVQVDDKGNRVELPTSQYSDGLIGWRKWAPRSQRSLLRWDFDDEGGVRGMYQQAAPKYETRYLPLGKCLLFRANAINDNPEGESLLRGCYTSWYTQKQLQFIQAVGFKRDLTGLPVVTLPPEIVMAASGTPEATVRDEWEKIITRLCVDEQSGCMVPGYYDANGNQIGKLELLASPGGKQSNIKEAIEYYDTRIAQVLFTDFLLFGHTKIGTQSTTSARIDDVYTVALSAWMNAILEVINRRAIPQLLGLNGMRPQVMPKAVHGKVGNPDLAMLSQYITALATAGMMLFPSPDGQLEDVLLNLAELPTAKNVTKRAVAKVGDIGKRRGSNKAKFAEMATAMVEAARELRGELAKRKAA